MIATLVRSIFEQPDRDATWSQLSVVIDRLTQAGFCDLANDVLDAADDILAFSRLPRRALAPEIRSTTAWTTIRYPDGGEAQVAETTMRMSRSVLKFGGDPGLARRSERR